VSHPSMYAIFTFLADHALVAAAGCGKSPL
jgi:hypothetical protein